MRILIVDDNEANRMVARMLLERKGHIVIYAENGQLAVTQCEGVKFDLILMDIMMPVMDGIKALGHIRRSEGHNKNTPIFALTAYCSALDRLHYDNVGFDAILVKPLKTGDLSRAWDSYKQTVTETALPVEISEPAAAQQGWKKCKLAMQNIERSLPETLSGNLDALEAFRESADALRLAAAHMNLSSLFAIAGQVKRAQPKDLLTLLPILIKTASLAEQDLSRESINDDSYINDDSWANPVSGASELTTLDQSQPLQSSSQYHHTKSAGEVRRLLG